MTKDHFPALEAMYPIRLADGSVHEGTVFLANVVEHPRTEIGEYTYASAFRPPENWAAYLAPYLYDFSPEMLRIGKFCQIADGVMFVTSSANHRHDGLSSFPFAVFEGKWDRSRPSIPKDGPDTVIGHDVWIGQGARILPGTQIGNGVIVGAGAVVGGKVPDYTVVGGNPARVIRRRVSPEDADRMRRIAWWDWPIDKILAHESLICGADIKALAAI